jgi:diaminopimelate epimerase
VIDGTAFYFTSVSMGNPHAVLFYDELAEPKALRELAELSGPAIEHHPRFPSRTNVEFVHKSSDTSFTSVIWERGCGITLACGTGACAVAVAACLTGRASFETPLDIHVPGGSLTVRVANQYRQVYLRGPAATVYRGELA